MRQSAAAQKRQFGYNNDFLGYIPMPGATEPSRHGLLVVNHEYTNEELIFPGIGRQDLQGPKGAPKEAAFARMTRELVEIEKAAHGGSVLEVRRAATGNPERRGRIEIRAPDRRGHADGNLRSGGGP